MAKCLANRSISLAIVSEPEGRTARKTTNGWNDEKRHNIKNHENKKIALKQE
jgi:hypothetical protein